MPAVGVCPGEPSVWGRAGSRLSSLVASWLTDGPPQPARRQRCRRTNRGPTRGNYCKWSRDFSKGTDNKTDSQRACRPLGEFSFRGVPVLWLEMEEGVGGVGAEAGSLCQEESSEDFCGTRPWRGAWTRASLSSAGRALPGGGITGCIKHSARSGL